MAQRIAAYRIPIKVNAEVTSLTLIINMRRKLAPKRAVAALLSRHSSSAPRTVETPWHHFLRDMEKRLAQAQKESERRQLKSQEFLAQAQKESEKRLIDRMNVNSYKVAALTIAGAAGLGSFFLFLFHSAGF